MKSTYKNMLPKHMKAAGVLSFGRSVMGSSLEELGGCGNKPKTFYAFISVESGAQAL
jgi:hypothetical protein